MADFSLVSADCSDTDPGDPCTTCAVDCGACTTSCGLGCSCRNPTCNCDTFGGCVDTRCEANCPSGYNQGSCPAGATCDTCTSTCAGCSNSTDCYKITEPVPTTPPPPECSSCTSWTTHESCGFGSCGVCQKEQYCSAGAPSWCTRCQEVGSCCGALPTPTPACWGYHYCDYPATGSTLMTGQGYDISGWARFCSGPAGAGVMNRVDIHLCDQGTWDCQGLAGSITDETSRPETAFACDSGNPNNGWYYNWTVPESSLGSKTIRVAAINDAATTCLQWCSADVTINATPNCSNLTGPSSLYVGQTGTYTTDCVSAQGDVRCRIYEGASNLIVDQTTTGNNLTVSGDWTPSSAGTYTINCRAWNDARAECRYAPYVDSPPRYACVGPNHYKTVTVTECTPNCLTACGQSDGCFSTCNDLRSSLWSNPAEGASVVHDLPITISGWAKDLNGLRAGVESVAIYQDNQTNLVSTLPTNSTTGVFSSSLTADFYTSGLTGSESHTFYAKAIGNELDADCNDWWLVNAGPSSKTINITNSAPTAVSLSPNSGDVVLDLGGPEVDFTAIFRDTDAQQAVTGRDHDVRIASVRIGEAADPLLTLTYTDNDVGVNTFGTVGDANGIVFSGGSATPVDGGNLTLDFTLDFGSLTADLFGTYNLYMLTTDWAGASTGWQNMGSLQIWDGDSVLVTGRVADVSSLYAGDWDLVSCDSLAGQPALSGVTVHFTSLGACAADGDLGPTDPTEADGSYTTTLRYGCSYRSWLEDDDYFGVKTQLKDVLVTGDECRSGADSVFQVSGGSGEVNLGMSQLKSPWIQVVGSSLTSYGSVNASIPSSCVGGCSPYLSINSLELPQPGVVVARSAISIGSGLAVGSPDDWQVVDGNLSPVPGDSGFDHYLALMGDDYLVSGDQSVSEIASIADGVGVGEQEFVLVDGNLTIDQNLTVAEGGLLLLAASGNVIVADGVTRADGIFLADGSVLIQGSSPMANLNGVWVADADGNGSGSLTNSRDLGSDNNTSPAATFTFRPDLIVNLVKTDVGITEPGLLKWEEIKP